MTMYVRDGGAWHDVIRMQVRDGGAWQDVIQGWVREGGVWEPFFASGAVDLNDHTVEEQTGGGISSYTVNADGTVYESTPSGGSVQVNAATDWLVPNTGPQDYQARFINKIGSVTSPTHTEDVWQALSSSALTIRVNRTGPSGPGTTSGSARVEIRKGTGSVLAFADIALIATIA